MKSLSAHLAGKKHVLWDWNGTLLDDVDHCVEVICGIATLHGLPRIDRTQYLELFRFPVMDYYKDVGFDFARTPFEELTKHFVSGYSAKVRDLTLFAGAAELLEELGQAGIKCSVLSAAYETELRELLSHYGIAHHFAHVYGLTNHFAQSKVDRGRELLAVLGHPPEELILVGDTDHDAEVGEALGIDVLLVSGGHQNDARLIARHPRVIRRGAAG